MLIRGSAWQAVGRYDETMRDGTEDWEFNIRLSRSGFRGIELPKPLFVYDEQGLLSFGVWRVGSPPFFSNL